MNVIVSLPNRKLLSGMILSLAACLPATAENDHELISWDTKKLSPHFYGEGAFHGDFNKDGIVDVVSGPFWYQGPEFSQKHEYRPANQYDPVNYSDNFLTFVHDFNRDGWDDILIIGWPGYKEEHEHVWYENPKGKEGAWPSHHVFKEVDNESPAFGNLVGDENPELIFHYKGHLGWAAPDPDDPTKPWTFHKISENLELSRYAHGLGFGDVNGDGRADFVQSKGWWEQPESIVGDPLWKHHTWPFKLDGAQMLVYDVDGDGDNDIITAIASHGYGIAWLEHTKTDKGAIEFKMHRFINEKPEENRYGVQFSQPHAFDVADFNGDGLTDFVVGKRFWAHGPKGDPEPNAAAVTYWFELKRGVEGLPGGVDFVPHLIHDDSGVGTQVAAADLNNDGLTDVISGNKKGTHVHLQMRKSVSEEAWKAAQPKLFKAGNTVSTVWDLTDLFPSVEAWETALKEVSDGIPKIESYQGKLGESAAILEEALKTQSALHRKLAHVYVYTSLKADENLGASEPQARKQRVLAVSSKLRQSSSWVGPEIIALGAEKIEAFIAEAPGLAPFDHRLRSTLRQAPHTLNPEAERVMAAAGKLTRQPSQIYSIFANADLPWPTITLSDGEEVYLNQSGYSKYRAVDQREDRKAVFDAFWSKLGEYKNTMGQALLAEVEANVFQSQMRHYDNILEWALSGDNLPEEVYRSLVKVTNESLPTLHRYFTLRGRMLGVEDIRYYDIYPDLVQTDEVFGIERSIETTIKGVAALGDEYGKLLKAYSKVDHTHVYPQKGKRSGAYMSGSAYDTDPYMLLNHNNDYNSMSTYAHEVGHALHTILTKANQPFEKSSYSTFIAETAAIVNELMLQDHALENAKDDQERLFYLGAALEQLRGTFFRQTMFAEFELAIHEEVEKGAPLTGDRLTQIYGDLLKRYHGHDKGVLTIDDAYCVEWAYIPHFYYDFYVFQYATSISAAAYYTEDIRKNGQPALENYLNVLKAGGADYPHHILMEESGLDMTKEAPYRALIRRMESIMDQIEVILDKQAE